MYYAALFNAMLQLQSLWMIVKHSLSQKFLPIFFFFFNETSKEKDTTNFTKYK